jgi:hypothetical protein
VLGSRTLPTASSSEARLGRCSFPDKTPIGADIHRSSDFPAPAVIRREIVTPSNLRLPDGIGCTRSCRPFPAATSLDIGTRTPIPVRPMAYPITWRTASSPQTDGRDHLPLACDDHEPALASNRCPRSSRICPANDRETSRNDGNGLEHRIRRSGTRFGHRRR